MYFLAGTFFLNTFLTLSVSMSKNAHEGILVLPRAVPAVIDLTIPVQDVKSVKETNGTVV